MEVKAADTFLLKLAELVQIACELDPSRERSMILTKLDEARHWGTDINLKIINEGKVI